PRPGEWPGRNGPQVLRKGGKAPEETVARPRPSEGAGLEPRVMGHPAPGVSVDGREPTSGSRVVGPVTWSPRAAGARGGPPPRANRATTDYSTVTAIRRGLVSSFRGRKTRRTPCLCSARTFATSTVGGSEN